MATIKGGLFPNQPDIPSFKSVYQSRFPPVDLPEIPEPLDDLHAFRRRQISKPLLEGRPSPINGNRQALIDDIQRTFAKPLLAQKISHYSALDFRARTESRHLETP